MSLIVWSGTRNCSWGRHTRMRSGSSCRSEVTPPGHRVGLNLVCTLPSTSWKCSPSSSDPRSQNHPSWTSLRTGRRPETSPTHRNNKRQSTVKQPVVWWLYRLWMNTPTQCLRSTSSSASHFRVRNGLFLLMISPAKNVVRVGYSYETEVTTVTLSFSLQRGECLTSESRSLSGQWFHSWTRRMPLPKGNPTVLTAPECITVFVAGGQGIHPGQDT